MRRWIRRLVVLLVLAAAGAGAWGLFFRPELIPVTVFSAAKGRVEETVTNSKAGTLKSRRRASLSPETAGRVEELPFRTGDHVEAGDVLVRLSDAETSAQVALNRRALEAAVASEREACTAAEQVRRDLARMEKLASEDIVSRERLEAAGAQRDASEAACEAAGASARRARAAIDVASATLAKTVLRAPFAGVVAELHAEVGEFVAPSTPGLMMPTLIDLIDPKSIYVSAPLDEVDVGRVHDGLPVRVTLDPYPDRAFGGHVSRVAPYVQDTREQSRTFEIEVELDPTPSDEVRLPPGTTADVEIILRAKEDVLRVPSYALLEGSRVLVVKDDQLVAVPVKTGLRNWEFVEVTDGLRAGDLVVVSLDRAEVKAGARVKVGERVEK